MIAVANKEGILEAQSELEKSLKKLNSPELHPMYSPGRDKILSFPEYVMEQKEKMDDLFYELAGKKGETLDSLKKRTLDEITSLTKRIARDGRH